MASVDEVATRTRLVAISLVTSVILNERGILTEKCSLVKGPGVARKREAFQRMRDGLPFKNLQVWKEVVWRGKVRNCSREEETDSLRRAVKSTSSSGSKGSSSSPAFPMGSLASNMTRRPPSLPTPRLRWFISKPCAPPSSKSSHVFRKSGSTLNSKSSFLLFSWAAFFARVDSDRWVALRRFWDGSWASGLSDVGSSPSASRPSEARLLRSFPVSVPTLSTRLVQILTQPSNVLEAR